MRASCWPRPCSTRTSGARSALNAIAAAPPSGGDTAAMARTSRASSRSAPFTGVSAGSTGRASPASRAASPRSVVNVSDRDYFKTVLATGKPVHQRGPTRRAASGASCHGGADARPERPARRACSPARRAEAVAQRQAHERPRLPGLVLLDRAGQQLTSRASPGRERRDRAAAPVGRGRATGPRASTARAARPRVRQLEAAGWTIAIDRRPSGLRLGAARAILELASIARALVVLGLIAWVCPLAARPRVGAQPDAALGRALPVARRRLGPGRGLRGARLGARDRVPAGRPDRRRARGPARSSGLGVPPRRRRARRATTRWSSSSRGSPTTAADPSRSASRPRPSSPSTEELQPARARCTRCRC